MISPIEHVEVLSLREPLGAGNAAGADLDAAIETVILRVVDGDGRAGIGECDAPPEAVDAFVNM